MDPTRNKRHQVFCPPVPFPYFSELGDLSGENFCILGFVCDLIHTNTAKMRRGSITDCDNATMP
eukprot:1241059-Amphidinium_carterae.1